MNTRQRDNRGEITSKEGFSVVAPINTKMPSSTYGSTISCCDLLNLWISSTNNIVRCEYISSLFLASDAILRKSATPDDTALNEAK